MRKFLSRVYSRAVIPYLVGVLLVLAAAVFGGREVELHINAIEAWIDGLGWSGVVVYIGLYAFATSLLVPTAVMCIIAGALFGVGWGILAVFIGSLAAGVVQFGVSHRLLKEKIDRLLAKKPSLVAIQHAVVGDGLRLQLLLRLTPLNPAIVSYLLGAAGVRFVSFAVALFALAPSLAIEVYFGHVGKHAARLFSSTSRTAELYDFAIIGGLAVCLLVMVVVAQAARKAVARAVSESEE